MNIVTRSVWTSARTQDSCTEKFATTSHTTSPFSTKEAGMVLWDTIPLSYWFTDFPSKVTIPHPGTSSLDLLACHVESGMNLDLITEASFFPEVAFLSHPWWPLS